MSNLRLLFNKNIDLCNNFTSLINNITISTVNIDKTNEDDYPKIKNMAYATGLESVFLSLIK